MPEKKQTETATLAPPKRRRVRAIEMGYYDHVRRREGDVFTINDRDFSERWMVAVDPHTPEQVTTGPQDLRRQHETLRADRSPQQMADDGPTGARNVLG